MRKRLLRRHLVFGLALAAALVILIMVLPAGSLALLLRSLFRQRLLIFLLLLFTLVTLSLLWSAGQRFDTRVFLFFNLRGRRPKWLDWTMLALTQLGNGIVAFGLAAYYALTGVRWLAILLALGIISLWLLVELVKALTVRARPYITLSNAGARLLGWRERGMSFPSGHTAQVFFLATLLVRSLETPPALTGALVALAGLVAFSRMYIGVHYPRDVLAGAILGVVWGILTSFAGPEPFFVVP